MLKILIIFLCVLVALFLLSLIIYFFNLDMKLSSKMSPILKKHYDRIKRDRRI
jgi:dolichol kinase